MHADSTIQIDFGHRVANITLADLRRWAAADASAADIDDARRAFKLKDTPEGYLAARELAVDIASQTPGALLTSCMCCGSSTFGADGLDVDLCEPCFELAGIDNQLNDEGRTLDADEAPDVLALLDDIRKAGGDAELALEYCDYLRNDPAFFA